MLKEITKGVASATTSPIINTASTLLSEKDVPNGNVVSLDTLINPSKVIGAVTDTSKNIITDTLTGTFSNISSPLTSVITDTLNSLLSITSLLSVAASSLLKIENILTNPTKLLGLLVTPLWNFLRRFLIHGIVLLLVVVGVAIMVLIAFAPVIIVTSPIWIPTGMVLLLVAAALLFAFGCVVAAVVTLLLAYRAIKGAS